MAKTDITELKRLAKTFLDTADQLNEMVSNYFDGSSDEEDEKAYNTVIASERIFLKAYNEYYNETIKIGLNYELAESLI